MADIDLPCTYVEGFHDENEIRNMKYSRLGKTDMKFSKLGIGGAALGNHYGKIDENKGITLVRDGIKHGINYIDTSPYYGHTYSETVIGKALVGIPRQAYHISTKVGRYGTSWADFFDHSAERIEKEYEASLKRLGLDYVDIVLVHDVEFSPIQKILTEALPAVQRLVDKKKANYIGISGYPVSVLWEIVEKSPVKIDVVLSYSRDCMFDSSLKTYASFFEAHHVGLVNASITGMGLLTNEGPPSWHPASKELKELCHKASLYCKEQDIELGKLAIHYAMQHPYVSSHLVGMKTLDELQCNLEIITKGLSEKELKVLDHVKQKIIGTENYHWEGVELAEYHKYLQSNEKK